TRWQVYDWRRRLRQGQLALPESMAPMFAQLMVDETSAPQRRMRPSKSTPGKVEIVIDDMVIRTAVDLEQLSQVIQAVRASPKLSTPSSTAIRRARSRNSCPGDSGKRQAQIHRRSARRLPRGAG
ncbi:hypothetical protein NKJ94_34990, partial [Mesorhizobium sp. M0060]